MATRVVVVPISGDEPNDNFLKLSQSFSEEELIDCLEEIVGESPDAAEISVPEKQAKKDIKQDLSRELRIAEIQLAQIKKRLEDEESYRAELLNGQDLHERALEVLKLEGNAQRARRDFEFLRTELMEVENTILDLQHEILRLELKKVQLQK